MVGQHELAELAPRDVVAKGIHRVLLATGADHVYLDARHLGGDFLAGRFPTIVASCLATGVDPATDLIPVAPAAHYASGGVRTDLRGRTSIPGLYACGEVACTGVHGANRLASNSLLEGLVFSRRIADDIAAGPARAGATGGDRRLARGRGLGAARPRATPTLQRAMTRGAGVLRSARDRWPGRPPTLTELGAGRGRPRHRRLGGDEPAHRGVDAGRRRVRPRGRPGAATGGRTSRRPTSGGAATWSGVGRGAADAGAGSTTEQLGGPQ